MRKLLKINFGKTNPETMDPEKFPEFKDANKLIFPDLPQEPYIFQKEHFDKDFKELDTLGSGKFTVKSYKLKTFDKKLAIKSIHVPHNRYNSDHDNGRRLVELLREIESFKKLANEPNIVNCYGILLYEGQALICMEQMDMSLKDVYLKIHELKKSAEKSDDDIVKTLTQEDVDMQEPSDRQEMHMEVDEHHQKTPHENLHSEIVFPEELLAYVAVAMLDALSACKRMNVIHRDIKPENVLLNKNGEIKLCDFGEARILHDSLASTFAGTLAYWPPERFEPEKAKFDVRADIWSLGITLVEIVRGSIPYRDGKGLVPNNIILLQNLILQLNTTELIENTFPNTVFRKETKEFVTLCLNRINERPKYDVLKETQFYKIFGTRDHKERNDKVAKYLTVYGIS